MFAERKNINSVLLSLMLVASINLTMAPNDAG